MLTYRSDCLAYFAQALTILIVSQNFMCLRKGFAGACMMMNCPPTVGPPGTTTITTEVPTTITTTEVPTTTTTEVPTTTTTITSTTTLPLLPADCADVQLITGATTSGTYLVYRPGCTSPSCATTVYCDLQLDGGGWTVIQNRVDGTTDFASPNWANYRDGFGTPGATNNFWLGNQYLYERTNQSGVTYQLLTQTTPIAGAPNCGLTSLYDQFSVANDADYYTLKLGGLFQSGGTVDNMAASRDQPFGTIDRSTSNFQGAPCPIYWQSGWWYDSTCNGKGDLNVPYDPRPTEPQLIGIVQETDCSANQRMQSSTMKIRPVGFNPNPG